LVQGDVQEGELPCGQDAGMIDEVLYAAEVIKKMVAQLMPVLEDLRDRVSFL
jgi:NAD(P)H-dependent flavin oxidoreductase YrpB (nitropropane dioxygenase family)